MSAKDAAQETAGALPDDQDGESGRDLRARCDALFREHNDALVRAVYSRVHSWEEATEVVQEALSHAVKILWIEVS